MLISETFSQAAKNQQSKACFLSIKSKDDALFCTLDNQKTNYLLELSTNTRYTLNYQIEYKYWDYINTFKPLASQSVENGNFYSAKTLIPGLFEYEFVEKMFRDSFKGNSHHS